ncbi:MAG TPA: vanadium-dependent haloperoxidase, partial [Pseudonocardiaceae bacterium]|nr:vanadium-dependent haloperoxidase [Pseudonocardiaceae bacterium]
VVLLPPSSGSATARTAGFDFDRGNAILELVIPTVTPKLLTTIAPSDATIFLRVATLLNNGWFDAIAPYHPTAVGVSSRLGRRPAHERTTHRQRNISLLHASYHILNSVLPQFPQQWRTMLTTVGLNPDDTSTDLTTPVGIGNRAGHAVVAAREHDGMNQLGDAGGRRYHRQPYADTTGYRSVNTPGELRDPSRWQPNLVTNGGGIFRAQEFVTPQYGRTRPYAYRHPAQFRVPPPVNSDAQHNPRGYRRQADEVLAVSAGLDDRRKLTAEHFDSKESLVTSVIHIAEARHFGLDEFVHLEFLTNLAAFDVGIAVWHYKARYDAVRPFSAIRHLYGDQRITAWGGPGQGRVTDITGAEWRSYLTTADHPEYPSGSASFCAAHATAARLFTGTDELGQTVSIARGASVVEPGVTPARDTTLTWRTWTQWAAECGRSRLWGGVHFHDSIPAGQKLGAQIGERAYQFVIAHLTGQRGDDHHER